jgi:hypothetical protein
VAKLRGESAIGSTAARGRTREFERTRHTIAPWSAFAPGPLNSRAFDGDRK